jgi:MOSC domain-containing protein YiiM
VLDVELPEGPGHLGTGRSFQACLSSVLELPLTEVPAPAGDLPASIGLWRAWLAELGLGLAPVVDPERFQWAGYWIAVLDEDDPSEEGTVALMFGTPPGVVLCPQDAGLLGRAAARLPVAAGFIVASLDPARRTDQVAPRDNGRVEVIAVAEAAESPMRRVTTARALPGQGLDGDRYAKRAGTFTPRSGKGVGYDLTLIEAEVLDRLVLPGGATLDYADARRNIVTRGIDLNALVGQTFRIGDVECVGRRLCEPCAHLETLTHAGVLRRLIHQGGLRADILSEGRIHAGDAVRP